MKLTLKKSIARTPKLLIAASALALGFTLIPAVVSAEPAASAEKRYESNQKNEKRYRVQRRDSRRHDDRRYDDRRPRDNRRYDNRRPDRRRYDNRHHDRRRYDNRHYDRRAPYRSPRHLSIPRQLLRHHLSELRSFFLGSFYHRAHHHLHRVYDFPVYVDNRTEYRPYAYCEGSLYEQPYRDDDYDYDYYD